MDVEPARPSRAGRRCFAGQLVRQRYDAANGSSSALLLRWHSIAGTASARPSACALFAGQPPISACLADISFWAAGYQAERLQKTSPRRVLHAIADGRIGLAAAGSLPPGHIKGGGLGLRPCR